MYKIFIFCSLLIIYSQKLVRKVDDDQNLLYFCFPINVPQKRNNTNDIQIFCSKDECFGILYSNNTNLVSNLMILCNEISCKIEKNTNDEFNEGILNLNEKYENFNKILLTCFKNNCIGGPIQHEHNKNDIDLINNNDDNIHNNQNFNDENNKQKNNLINGFLNEL